MTLEPLVLILAIGAIASVGLAPLLLMLKVLRKRQRSRRALARILWECPRDSREYPWSDYKGRTS